MVDETRLPFILCDYNVQRALETSGGVGESEWHSDTLEHAGMEYESRFVSILLADVHLEIP